MPLTASIYSKVLVKLIFWWLSVIGYLLRSALTAQKIPAISFHIVPAAIEVYTVFNTTLKASSVPLNELGEYRCSSWYW